MIRTVYLLVLNYLLITQAQDNLWKKPYIRYEPEDITVSQGEKIILNCGVMGYPRPTVTWHKGVIPLISEKPRIILPDYSLVIEQARRTHTTDDSGTYFCRAHNEHGSYTSRNATVTVEFIDQTFRQNPENVTLALEDKNYIFKCIPPEGVPKPEVEWYKNGRSLKIIRGLIETSTREDVHELHVIKVLWNFRGLYQCVARNSEGEVKSYTAEMKIKTEKPKALMSRDVLDVYENSLTILQCTPITQPMPSFIWSKVDGTMPPATRLKNNGEGKVEIMNTEFSDAGEYNCTVTNTAGTSFVLGRLNVHTILKFTIRPVDLSRGVGKRVEFHCSVTGGKSPVIYWIFQGTKYQSGRSKLDPIHVTDSDTFVILKLTLAHNGDVSCHAKDDDVKNSATKTSAKLTVTDTTVDAPVVTLNPTKPTVMEGEQLALTCQATGEGDLVFAWSIATTNALIYDSTAGVKLKTIAKRSDLTLLKVFLADSAVYRCLVTGDGGSSYELSNVTVTPTANKPPDVSTLQVVDIKSRSVKLKWDIPPTPSLAPITSFVITILNKDASEEKKTIVLGDKQSEKVITGLNPSTLYVFSIIAKNKMGSSQPKESVNIETLKAESSVNPPDVTDKLENIILQLFIGAVSYDSIEVKWNYVNPSRLSGYSLMIKTADTTRFNSTNIMDTSIRSYTVHGLKAKTKYQIKIKAFNNKYWSKASDVIEQLTIVKGSGVSRMLIGLQKVDNENLLVHLTPPKELKETNEIDSYEISCLHYDRSEFDISSVRKHAKKYMISGLDGYKRYIIFVTVKSVTGMSVKSKEYNVNLSNMKEGEVIGYYAGVTNLPDQNKDDDNNVLKIIKEPWFIATVGVFVWLLVLVCVILICCRRRKRKKETATFDGYKSTSGLLNSSTREYPNTSLSRRNDRWNGAPEGDHMMHQRANGRKGGTIGSCCKSQASSLDEDFPNKAEIKPMMTYTRHESIEMRPPKASNGDLSFMKENNIGVAMKNGYKVDAPLNNEINLRYPDYSSDSNRYYDSDERRHRPPPNYDDLVAPGSANINRDPRFKTDSVERRHAEIVRTATKKSFPDADLKNVLETNQQASWKRDKGKDSPKLPAPKPPGENTLRRQGKTQFKPLPKLEVLNWADGFPSKPSSSINDGSPSSSPKLSSAASVLSEGNEQRGDSRMSHGGSSNSLNKYSRRRKNSNASSMMSSELYQSEMDPSGYSDIYPAADKKKRKEKAVPPPIDLDGLTSDILLQWAESVTNSSGSSSGSSSPSRLSGISSEGSIYTDEDFAQAVAAVVECGGFNMDYDYSIPGMAGTQQPLSATRNQKMNKIDQVLAQRSKMRHPTSTPNNPKQRPEIQSPANTPSTFVPQISMSNYLTGSHKPSSVHSSNSGIPRATRQKTNNADRNNRRYGTGFDDIDSVPSSNPLTMSNLMRHDTSLERDKKPLTMSNLRQHETSLDRVRNRPQQRSTTDIIDKPTEQREIPKDMSKSNPQLLPEVALSVTSALERNESMNSKDSMNSSSKQDSEVENLPGTSERKPKPKKYFVNHSNNSSVSTVRTGFDDDTNC